MASAESTPRAVPVVGVIGNTLHVVEKVSGQQNHILIKARRQITTAVVFSARDTLSVVVATRDDKLWTVPIPSSQKTKGGKDAGVEQTMNEACEGAADSEDIFGELLEQKSSKIEKPNSNFPFQQQSCASSPNYTVALRPYDLLYTMDDTILDVAACNGLLSVLVNASGRARLDVFLIHQTQPAEGTKLELLQSFTTGLDVTLFCGSCNGNKIMYFAVEKLQTVPEILELPAASHSSASSSCEIPLSKSLFISIFGRETASLKSPVILLCASDGLVYTYAVKSNKNSSGNGLGIMCQMSSQTAAILPIEVSLPPTHSRTEQEEALAALTAALNREPVDDGSTKPVDGLVVMSTAGEGCLFLSPRTEDGQASALMFSLPHAVQSCVIGGKSLIYTTGRSIESCELTLAQGDDGRLTVLPVTKTLKAKAMVQKLLPFCISGKAGDTEVTGLTNNFEAVHISTTPAQDGNSDGASATQSLDDILQYIEQCSLKYKSVRENCKHIDSFILQMNIFASLAQCMKETKHTQKMAVNTASACELSKPFITGHCSISSVENIYRHNWTLKLTVKNDSAVSLLEDWVIVVTTRETVLNSSFPGHSQFNQSYSVPISRGLHSNSSIDVRVPLDCVLHIHPIPVFDVSVSLVLGLKNFNNLPLKFPLELACKGLKVEFHRQKFDILHFLNKASLHNLVADGPESLPIMESKCEDVLHTELKKMAKSRVTPANRDDSPAGKSQSLTLKLGVPDFVCKQRKLDSPAAVLKFLLRDTTIPVSAITGPSCHLQDPHQNFLGFTVASVSPASYTKEEKSRQEGHQFVITLRGDNLATLLHTRAAVKERLSVYDKRSESSHMETRYDLQTHLLSLERVREELNNTQSKLNAGEISKEERGKLLCEMLDKSEGKTQTSY